MLELYADECVDAREIAGWRRRNVDVRTASDEGLLGADDEVHLQRASALGRVVVSRDHDFLRLISARLGAGASVPGLIFIRPNTPIGVSVRQIVHIATTFEASELRNQIRWVS